MRHVFLLFIFIGIISVVNGQTDSNSIGTQLDTLKQKDKRFFSEKEIKMNEHLTIEIDSGLYKFGVCPKCYSINIQDTSRHPTTIILFSQNGDIIDFHQNFKNKIEFQYDEQTGKLKYILYMKNNGKYKRVKIK